MTNIVLFCAAGMSTSMLISKMEKAAQARGLEVKVNAYPEAQVNKYVEDADVVLIGPQIRYALAKIKKVCDEKGVPVEPINPSDYGMMNGDKVLDQALRLIKK
jgi:PTS system cellobiose-specific IIB component